MNCKLLRERIGESGYKLTHVAKITGLTYQGFLNKLNGDSDFRLTEIHAISELLGLDMQDREDIFFCKDVD